MKSNMAPYIYMERNGIHALINLYKTVCTKLEENQWGLRKFGQASGRKNTFVATKKQAKDIVLLNQSRYVKYALHQQKDGRWVCWTNFVNYFVKR